MSEGDATRDFVPRGHFYSPYAGPADIEHALATARRELPRSLPGIGIDDEAMRATWDAMLPHMRATDFPERKTEGSLYHYVNNMFSFGDADVYAGMLGVHRPSRVIEIGSGYSSALCVEVRERFGLDTRLTFIEPYPATLNMLQADGAWRNTELIERRVQDVDLRLFRTLEAGDILFIDSSHVAKAGSDVCQEVFRILPLLAAGVIIHFHDCFWPFEYPRPWIETEERNWSELYLLRAFLMFNNAFEITFFNHYFAVRHRAKAKEEHPRFLRNPGGGLWLRKKR